MMRGNRSVSAAEALEFLRTHVRVSEDGCHIWAGCCTRTGYPQVCWKNQRVLARRLMVSMSRATPLTPSQVVWDTCGDIRCMNPAHLRAGSRRQRAREKDDHGGYSGKVRFLAGARARAATARVGVARRGEVMQRLQSGMSIADLAREYGIRPRSLQQAIRRWDEVLGPWFYVKEAA